MKVAAAAMAIAGALMTVGASSAMAFSFTPNGTTTTGYAAAGSARLAFAGGAFLACQSTITARVSGMLVAYPPYGQLTFTNCIHALLPNTTQTVTAAQVVPTSTTTAALQIPSGGWTLNRPGCTITLGSGLINLPMQWSNVASKLSPPFGGIQIPYTTTGSCSGILPSGQVTFSIGGSGTGWSFFQSVSIV